jgi:NAD(P)-dependent dehydrogenase (short-subunit alcohol dehydrogenase family)
MAEAWTAASIPSLEGKRAIVTGANIGLGLETARELARHGAEVVLACRSAERGNKAAEEIRAEIPGAKLYVALLDLAAQASVRQFAEQVLGAGASVDILVLNAGIMAVPKRELSPDGWERQLATNYLGHYALTGLLLPVLLGAGAPRVVSLSSNAHKRAQMRWDDLQYEQGGYTPMGAYSQTKLAMLLYARELQRQADTHGAGKLLSVAAHPGLSSTAIVRELTGPIKLITSLAFRFVGQDEKEGALPQLYAAAAPGVKPGGYYGPTGLLEFKGAPGEAKLAPQATDAQAAERLWQVSEQLTGVRYPWPA